MISSKIENALQDVLVDKAPKLPENGKTTLVQYLPWIVSVLGVLTLLAAWSLWHWAHATDSLVNYVNSINKLYGGGAVATNRLSLGIWIGLVVLIIEGLLYLASYPGLRDHRKSGWNLLFYASIANILYAIIIFFTDYGGIGTLLASLIGTAIGLYLLFQIRSYYMKSHSVK